MSLALQLKRGLKANLPLSAAAGEPLFTLDTKEIFLGTGTGLVKFADVHVGTTAPEFPYVNQLWMNTTTNQLTRYDGAAWVISSGQAATWGHINGLITDQADLQAALNAITAAFEADDAAILADLAAVTAGKGASLVGFYDTGAFAGAATVQQAIVKVKGDIDAEAISRAAGDTALQSAIDTEASTRISQDQLLRTDLNTVTDGLAAEAITRANADTTLQANIDAEVNARELAVTTITTNLNTEIADRTAADSVLQTNIDTLAGQVATLSGNTGSSVADLESQIDAVEIALATETTNRTSADTTLQANIDAEASTRAAADLAINTALSAETADRTSADAALQGLVDGLQASKAEKAGSATQVFEVADAVISTQAANLGQLNAGLDTKAAKQGDNTLTFKAATPVAADDVATKAYVDNVATGLDPKASVKALADSDIVLSGTQMVDGVSLIAGDRILVIGQTDKTQNGIYAVAAGAWSRAGDADNSPQAEVSAGMFTFVEEGTIYANSGWVLATDNNTTIGTTPAIALGSTELTFAQFSGNGTYTAAEGIALEGQVFKLTETGVGAGTYTKVTVDLKGRVTSAVTPTTLAGYSIVDAAQIDGSATQTFKVAAAASADQAVNKGQADADYLHVDQTLDMGTF